MKKLLGAFLFSTLLTCLSYGGVQVTPFLVSKVSPSGNYSTADFLVIWSAFREQYRLGPKGTFIQYPFSKETVNLAVRANRYSTLGAMFQEPNAGDTGGHLAGVNQSFENSSRLLTVEDAKEYVMKRRTSFVTLRVGNESVVTRPGAFECVLVNQPSAVQALDTDLREPVAPRQRTSASGPSYIYFADPSTPKQGEVELRVSKEISFSPDSSSPNTAYIEVATLQDTKQNQDNLIEALKAGSCFRVYVFKMGACYNCGGFGRLSGKATAGRSSGYSGSSLSLSGSSSLNENCKLCSGSGRLPLGKVYALVWERYVPVTDDQRPGVPR